MAITHLRRQHSGRTTAFAASASMMCISFSRYISSSLKSYLILPTSLHPFTATLITNSYMSSRNHKSQKRQNQLTAGIAVLSQQGPASRPQFHLHRYSDDCNPPLPASIRRRVLSHQDRYVECTVFGRVVCDEGKRYVGYLWYGMV